MHISNKKYRIAQMTYQHLNFVSKFFAESFLFENKVWASFNPPFEEVQKFMYDKTLEMLQWQQELRLNGTIGPKTFINFVYLDEKDQIVSAWTNFELTQYMQRDSKVRLQSFGILESYRPKLQKTIHPKDIEAGRTIYGMFIGVKKELLGSGLTMLFWLDGSHYLNSQGFRVFYGRASNFKSMMLMKRYGGQVTAKLRMTEVTNKQLYLYMVKWYLDPIQYVETLRNHFVQKSKL